MEEHFETLYKALMRETERHAEEVPVTVERLAQLLCCTERNVKLIVKAMADSGWIGWRPGRGRGNGSRLAFLTSPEQLLAQQARMWLSLGKEREALELIKSGRIGASAVEPLIRELAGSLGYRVEHTPAAGRVETLRFSTYRLLGRLDPAYVTRRTELHMVRQLFDTLVEFDRAKGEYKPALAHHWECGRDGTCWVFYLQKHVLFHHGSGMTARDVAATIRRLQAADDSPYRPLFAAIRDVRIRHDYEVELRLAAPDHRLPALLGSTASSIVPCDWDSALRTPPGAGPFRLARHDDVILALEAFAPYYRRRPHLDRVEMWFLPSLYEKTAPEAEEGPFGVNFQHYPYAGQGGKEWKRESLLDRGCKWMTLNAAKGGPLADRRVRRRIGAAIDRRRMIGELGGNRSEEASGFVLDMEPGPRRPSWAEEPEMTSPAWDKPVRLSLYTYEGAGNERESAWLREALRAVAVDLEVVLVPYDELLRPETIDAADMLLLEQAVDEDEEWTYFFQLGNPDSPVRRHMSPELAGQWTARLERIRAAAERSLRLELWHSLERELAASGEILFLYRRLQHMNYPQQLRGASISSFGWSNYKNLWFAST
ncbi:ABC transporter substrate-binding protein [Paenibacillus hamazuiensis]|uniref:ABC transporter substrate-binding protein n=1 Tax=Paenibacillus hamazuiensis TaxID=2936508 RepID=UPI00200D66EB|nr:ABC transporter substrate-binding protein [Paenibacillus hamazuiensis]